MEGHKINSELSIVLHIYKTAGKSLLRDFRYNLPDKVLLRMYGGPVGLDKSQGGVNPGWDIARINDYVTRHAGSQTKCIFGHMAYFGMHSLLPAKAEPRYITFLRDPVERCISWYYHLKNNSQTVWHQEIVEGKWSVEEWFEKSSLLGRYDGQLRQILLGTSFEEVLTAPELTREHLEEGKRRLRQFHYVGLTETFDEDSYYLYGKLNFRRFPAELRTNVSPGKKEVSPAIRRVIAERNALDMELYEFARELRAEFVRRNAQDWNSSRRKAAMMRSLGDIWPLSYWFRKPVRGSSVPKTADGGNQLRFRPHRGLLMPKPD
jgi:Sulfotransferase family